MKKILLTALTIGFVTTSSASMFIDASLPLRCHEAAKKIDKAREKIEDETCRDNIWGYGFENAGKSNDCEQN